MDPAEHHPAPNPTPKPAPAPTPSGPQQQRESLVKDAILGFVAFFAFMSVVQATMNLLQPEPALWPALLALVLVIATVALWRAWKSPNTDTGADTGTGSGELKRSLFTL
ncbi:hypothetical protein [Corynebacterium sp. 70RC1]|uniref:hypothetical protein n=2 Tax=Corynebacterium TaxID=1716 RepID=UPI003593F18F